MDSADEASDSATGSSHASRQRRARNKSRGQASALREGGRTRARCYLPGAQYKITRRCIDRRLFLVPDNDVADELNNLIGYVYALATERYGVELHAACYMSNHHHSDITDNKIEARVADFKRFVHSVIARAVNTLRGKDDGFWSHDPPTDTLRPPGEAGVADLVYTLANPTKAALVRNGGRWPGFTTHGWRFGETRTFTRPAFFFDPENPNNPPTASLTLTRPPALAHLTDEEATAFVYEQLRIHEKGLEQTHGRAGRKFMGESKVRKQKWHRRPRTPADRFVTRPQVAAGCRWARMAQLQRNRLFRRAYIVSRDAHLDPSVTNPPPFPFGTYAKRVFEGRPVAPPTPEVLASLHPETRAYLDARPPP